MCMCKYCGAFEPIPHVGNNESRIWYIWFSGEGRYYLETYDRNNKDGASMEINYCPMCGCKL